MANVLMCWEIGQNLGHVMPLVPIAKTLRSQGHHVVFALKELHQLGRVLSDEGFAFVQCPVHLAAPTPSKRPLESAADILLLLSYDHPAILQSYLRAWRELMSLTMADLVVASYAPTALLAARTLGLKTASIGTAFELPPPCSPMPSFRPWLKTEPDLLKIAESAVVACVNAAMEPFGQKINQASEVFASDKQILATFPELDPHFETRSELGTPIYSGAVFAENVGEPVAWPDVDGKRVFGYLRGPVDKIAEWIGQLASVDASFCIVSPQLNSAQAAGLSRRNIRVESRTVNLSMALAQCEAVVCYASHGLVSATLLAGKPMVLIPTQMEGVTIARQVQKIGAAIVVGPDAPKGLAEACKIILSKPEFGLSAKRFRKKYLGYDKDGQARRIAELLADLSA